MIVMESLVLLRRLFKRSHTGPSLYFIRFSASAAKCQTYKRINNIRDYLRNTVIVE